MEPDYKHLELSLNTELTFDLADSEYELYDFSLDMIKIMQIVCWEESTYPEKYVTLN